MKKTINIAILFLTIGIVATSCKKEETVTPTVVGLWTGKYSNVVTSNDFTNGYAALVRSNGTVRFFDGSDTTTASKAEGTYTSVGNTFNATYTYSGGGTFGVTATVNSINAFMEGTWGSGTSTTSGKFFMHKP